MNKDKLPIRKGSLGKGMSSLLGDINLDSLDEKPVRNEKLSGQLEAEVIRIKINEIEPNPYQPRKVFDDHKLKELAASLKQDGFLQPIVVSRSEIPGKFIIIAGERRWRASKLNGFETVPVIVKDTTTEEMLRLALIENIQRANLNVIEEAEAYASLIRDYGLTQEQCADKVGKERSSVTNTLRLLALPREIQDDIIDSRLSMGHGRSMLSLEDKKLMLRCRDIVIKKNLSVRQTEQLVKTFKEAKEDEADLQYITESLRSYLHTKVKLAGTTSRGKIEISYFSAAELERLMKLMGHKF